MSSADVAAGRRADAAAWRAWLQLARISNAPTVVSNAVAGAMLATAGAGAGAGEIAIVALAMVMFYTAGMVLNDVLDLQIDRRERPERPLPGGRVSVGAAVTATAVLFVSGEALLLMIDWAAGLAGVVLVGLIVLYDAWHKGNALSPVLMGACRAMVYVVAALAVAGSVRQAVWGAAAVLLIYIVGLTQVAKAEGAGIVAWWPVAAVLAPAVYWARELPSAGVAALIAGFLVAAVHALWLVRVRRAIGRGVGQLIATVALLDALAVAAVGGPAIAVGACVAAFAATVALQTRIAGT